MRSMSEDDVVVGVWGIERESEGWFMLRACEAFARARNAGVGTRDVSLLSIKRR